MPISQPSAHRRWVRARNLIREAFFVERSSAGVLQSAAVGADRSLAAKRPN
jgi:hypothetical protein